MNGATAMKMEEHFTYADYLTWEDDHRWEIIDGKAYQISAPSVDHQAVILELAAFLHDFLKGKPCRAFVSPIDVRLHAQSEEDEGDDTVVQPDILVVCDKKKIGVRAILGAPDLVIEVLSESTASRDHITKLKKYMEVGVKEYWIVNPSEKNVSIHIRKAEPPETTCETTVMEGDAVLRSTVLPDIEIELSQIFAEI
ncbi:MAG: Uma2 family endonuclease [Clostridiales Family XIII bacterium]|jgi:Uma2 family endonuclease|nr:Uma2 family endonuclease [Clostridiales Family XIII bacterium]